MISGFQQLLLRTLRHEALSLRANIGRACALAAVSLGWLTELPPSLGVRLPSGGDFLFNVAVYSALAQLLLIGSAVAPALTRVLRPGHRDLLMLTDLSPGQLFTVQISGAVIQTLLIAALLTPLYWYALSLGELNVADLTEIVVGWFVANSVWLSLAALVGVIRGPRAEMDGVTGGSVVLGAALCVSCFAGFVFEALPRSDRWTALALVATFASFGLLVAGKLFGAACRPAEPAQAPPIAPLPDASHPGQVSTSYWPARPRCGDDPWWWKDYYVQGNGLVGMLLRMVIAILLTMVCGLCALAEGAPVTSLVLTATLFGCWLVYDAVQVFRPETQQQMLELLSLLPMPPRTLLVRKLCVAAARFSPALLPLATVGAFACWRVPDDAVRIFSLLLVNALPTAAVCLLAGLKPRQVLDGQRPLVSTLLLLLMPVLAAAAQLMVWDPSAVRLGFAIAAASSAAMTTLLVGTLLLDLQQPSSLKHKET
jgi:hypothetical protein